MLLLTYLPHCKSYWIHDCWLDDLLAWEHTPCDSNRFILITVCVVSHALGKKRLENVKLKWGNAHIIKLLQK